MKVWLREPPCNLTQEEWKLIADSGVGVSIAAPVEMEMGHGVPPCQQTLGLKIPGCDQRPAAEPRLRYRNGRG